MLTKLRLWRLLRIKTMLTCTVTLVSVMVFLEMIRHGNGVVRLAEGDPDETLAGGGDESAVELHVPGSFFRGNSPVNESYCGFRFGLPERFAWTEEDVVSTPELGLDGPYRVVYNVVNGSVTSPEVTYCTHATPEFVFHVSEIARTWEGAVSVALFVPHTDAQLAIDHLQQLCVCLPDMQRVSVHFVFPVDAPPAFRREDPVFYSDCSVPNLSDVPTHRGNTALVYPVNAARNVAREGARTRFLLVSDVELIPSAGLASKFTAMMHRIHYHHDTHYAPKHAFVVPVFEVERSQRLPRRKAQLQRMYADGNAVYFHRWVCLHCQRFPGLQRWLTKPCAADSIKPLVVVRREFPYHRWEPIFIGTHRDPFYSEALSWEGLQDKMTQMLEMCLMQYRFVILDGAFLVHTPGMKRRTAPLQDAWRRPYQRRNTKEYTAILRVLAAKYERNARCRLQ